MPRKILTLIVILTGLAIIPLIAWPPIRSPLAAECETNCGSVEECSQKISVCQQIWNDVQKAKAPHEASLKKMESDIAAFQLRIVQIGHEVAVKEKEIGESEAKLGEQEALLAARVRSAYIRSFWAHPILLLFMNSSDFGLNLRTLAYQQAVSSEDRRIIVDIVSFVKDLEEKKQNMEQEKIGLAELKDKLAVQAAATKKLVDEASAYQSKLSSSIATLSAKQQQFLAEKLAGLGLPTSLGAGPLYCTDDRNIDPGFSPAFAFYTFGIPHRVGMNQYGAYGRAKANQNYQEILRAYFDGISFEGGKENITISVAGHGSMPLDEYLLGIYEMPESWPLEALKAQAVAARSYALAYTGNGSREICITQACQVWKPEKKAGAWKTAVEQTRGEVMTHSGQVITAWYSSTDGGYTYRSSDVGWSDRPWTKRLRDTSGDVASFSELLDRGYDKDSPCFYAAQGWRSQYGKSAWLKSSEVADIVNVILLARKDSSTKVHLYQTDKPNPEGQETWDENRVRQELGSGAFTSVSSISISEVDWGMGRTTQVTVSGDGGTVSIDGTEFRNFFNLRAPANIQIVGPLYNVERR